jgi:hypothetical protein
VSRLDRSAKPRHVAQAGGVFLLPGKPDQFDLDGRAAIGFGAAGGMPQR